MTLRPMRERKQNKYDQEDYFTPNNPELENMEVFIKKNNFIFLENHYDRKINLRLLRPKKSHKRLNRPKYQ
jgi:hypothetical protein